MSYVGKCICDEWETGSDQILAQALFCEVHSAGPKYTAPPFKYCPWCGTSLAYKDIESED